MKHDRSPGRALRSTGPIADHASDLIAAISIGTLQISVAISFAALIFTDELSTGVPRAAVGYIVGTAVVVVGVAQLSRMEMIIAGAQDTAVVVAAALAAALASSTEPDARLPTVFVAIGLATVLTGVVFLVVGRARLAVAARSIPSTVVSGFTAGTGWLLLRGGYEVMLGRHLTWGDVPDLFTSELVKYWLPGIALSILIVIALGGKGGNALVGMSIIGTAAAVHVIGRVVSSADVLESDGWLVGPFDETDAWKPILPSDLVDTDWGAILDQSVAIAALATVSLMGLLLNLTGLESTGRRTIDLDHETAAAGASNVVAGLAGGVVGYHLLGDTIIARQLGVKGRLAPFLIGSLALISVVVGAEAVALLPRAVAGGVLAAAGLTLLVNWVNRVRSDLDRLDAVLSTVILGVIIAFGVLTGVAAGIMIATVIFVFSYSRVSPIHRVHRLDSSHSNVDRSRTQREFLDERSDSVIALELDGYLFFGSMRRIALVVLPLMDDHGLEYVVIDTSNVRGLDASVVAGFATLDRHAIQENVRIVWSGLDDDVATRLARSGVRLDHRVDDLDHALELVEDDLLSRSGVSFEIDPGVAEWLERIRPHGTDERLRSGEVLVRAGDTSRAVYVVLEGTLTAWTEADSGDRVRLRTVGPGSVLGEVSHFTGAPRTATVIADGDAQVIRLGTQEMAAINEHDPSLAVETERRMASRLAERIAATSAMVRQLRT